MTVVDRESDENLAIQAAIDANPCWNDECDGCDKCQPEPCWECDACDIAEECEVNPPEPFPSLVGINGQTVKGMLPLFHASTYQIVNTVIGQQIEKGEVTLRSDGDMILNDMVFNQDIQRFMEHGRNMQAAADALEAEQAA